MPTPTTLHDACKSGTTAEVREQLALRTVDGSAPLWDVNGVNKLGAAPLHVACQRPAQAETIQILQVLIDAGAQVEAPAKDGSTALHLACTRGNIEAVHLLIRCDANVNAVDKRKQSVLHAAVKQGSLEIIERLLNHGADAHAVDKFDRSLLHVAVQRKSLEAMRLLLSAGVGINAVDSDGWSLLHVAVMGGDVGVLEALILEGIELNTMDQNGKSPLFLAIIQGASANMVELLVTHGADVNTADNDSVTLLQFVVEHGTLEMLDMLVQHGGRVTDVDANGKSILHAAIERGREDVLRYLMEKGVDINAVDKNGQSILHIAVAQDRKEIVAFLIKRGVDMSVIDKEGKLLLHVAIEHLPKTGGSIEMIAFLISRGVDLNSVDARGHTPLHVACYLDRFMEAVTFLLSHGATEALAVEDEDGFCPLHIAAQNLNVRLVKQLLDAGAQVNAPCRGGETPLGIAFFVYNTNCEHAYKLAYAVCMRGGEWDATCDERMSEGRARAQDALEASREKDTKEATEELQQEVRHELLWRLGLRACVLYWMQQRRNGADRLVEVPIEVIERGDASVTTYLKDMEHSDADKLVYRRKICVVGPGEWGKTSLVKSLTTLEPSLVHQDDRTIGIDLFSCAFVEQVDGATTTKTKRHEVTFWDFAGQEIYQVAHALFYSKRTLYLICVDLEAYARTLQEADALATLRQSDAAIARFVRRHIFKWVRSIFARQPDAEFVVVGTKTDQLSSAALAEDVWQDLRLRLKTWQDQFIAELEEEVRVAKATLSAPTAKSFAFLRAGKSDLLAQLDALKHKVIYTVSEDWLVVSNAERASVRNARYALEHHLTVNDRGFPMSITYSQVLEAIRRRQEQTRQMDDDKERIESCILPYKALLRSLLREIDGLQDGECAAILRTLHDLGDVLWYEREGAGALKDVVIIDPTLVIDFVREVINHKLVTDEERKQEAGHVAHALLATLPLWSALDQELMHAFKLLLQYFQLAYPADGKEMDWDSDLIVPAYWKQQQPQQQDPAVTSIASEAFETAMQRHGFSATSAAVVCWEYELSDEISETIFEHFAVQSYTSLFERCVVGSCIESHKDGEFVARISMAKDASVANGNGSRVVLGFQVATPSRIEIDDAWQCMRYFVMTMEKVLESYPGLTVSRYILDLAASVETGTRHRVNNAVKALEDAASMGRDEASVRVTMPWLPSDFRWYIEKAWRRPGALHDLQMRSLLKEIHTKTDVLKKLIVASSEQRQYPALWTLEVTPERDLATLRMLSDLSGLCFHTPLEIPLPPRFLATHGDLLQCGLSVLSTIVSSALSIGILDKAVQVAKSALGATADTAVQVYSAIDALEVSADAGFTSTANRKLSPAGTTALLKQLLKLCDSNGGRLTVSDMSNLQCAATASGHYIWANRQEIMALGDKLTPCDPVFDSTSEDEPEPTPIDDQKTTAFSSAIRLVIDSVAGLAAWDWRKAYCKWQLMRGGVVLEAGATSQHTEEAVAPSWSGLFFSVATNRVPSVEALRECRLQVDVLRPSRLLGMIKVIGTGSVELAAVIAKDAESPFDLNDITIPLVHAKHSCQRSVTCRLSGA